MGKPFDFATDSGPSCVRCGGTTWSYTFTRYGAARCGGCGMTEGPLRLRDRKTAPKPATAEEARVLHEQLRRGDVP